MEGGEGKGPVIGISYSCFLQTRKDPELEKEGRKDGVLWLLLVHMHRPTQIHTHNTLSLQRSVTLILHMWAILITIMGIHRLNECFTT